MLVPNLTVMVFSHVSGHTRLFIRTRRTKTREVGCVAPTREGTAKERSWEAKEEVDGATVAVYWLIHPITCQG